MVLLARLHSYHQWPLIRVVTLGCVAIPKGSISVDGPEQSRKPHREPSNPTTMTLGQIVVVATG